MEINEISSMIPELFQLNLMFTKHITSHIYACQYQNSTYQGS